MNDEQRIKAINSFIEKLAKGEEKNEQYKASIGCLLQELKEGKTGAEWEKLIKERCNIARSRANELIAIADGRRSEEQTAALTTARSKKHRENKAPPLRNGKNKADEPATTDAPTSLKAEEQPDADNGDEYGHLECDGSYAVVNHTKPRGMRIQGFFFRAHESARGARMDDMAGIAITQEMLDAAHDAAAAWAELCRKVEPEVAVKVEHKSAPAPAAATDEITAIEIERFGSWLLGQDIKRARELHRILREEDDRNAWALAGVLGRGLGIDDDASDREAA